MWLCFFRLASSLDMNFYYIFLLLLVVLSAYSERPQYGKPPDPLDPTLPFAETVALTLWVF